MKINHKTTGFTTNDLAKTKKFYSEVLGCTVTEEYPQQLTITTPDGFETGALYKGNAYKPAPFTILNFEVDDIISAVKELKNHDVEFLQYEDPIKTDENGICWGDGICPINAWFKDPAGNIIAILQMPQGHKKNAKLTRR